MPTITADSIPDYDDWGIDEYWSCDDWITWHKLMKQKYSKTYADQHFMEAWNKQDTFESNYNWCKYNGTFNSYARQENLNVTWWLPNILNNVSGVAEDASDAVKSTSNILKIAVPALIIIAAIGGLVFAAKKLNIIK